MNAEEFNAETMQQAWQLKVDEELFHGHIDWHLSKQRFYLTWSLFPLGAMGGALLTDGSWAWWSVVIVYGMYAACLGGSLMHSWLTHRHFKQHNHVEPEEFMARRVMEWEHLHR